MTTTITASFEVTDWKEEGFDERSDAAKLTMARVTKSYAGDIDGDSVTEWLMAYAEDGSAAFVGLERIRGRVGERSGTLVVRHVGDYRDGSATAELTVVAASGSGDLAGVSGRGDFVANPGGKVTLDLELD